MILNETLQNWSNLITEELGVKDQTKLSWMSEYARNHEIYESVQTPGHAVNSIYATPLNTLGMGNPMMPMGVAGQDGFNANGGNGTGIGNTGADFHNPLYKTGSGDIPMSTLAMSLEVAAMTIGLELVPVIPANGPWAMLSYMDFPYAGGKMGRLNETWVDGKGEDADNKPIYIKVLGANVDAATKKANAAAFKQGAAVVVGKFNGEFIGFSRIDNAIIAKVKDCTDADTSIADAFAAASTVTIGGVSVYDAKDADGNAKLGTLRADLVAGMADHVQGFSNFFSGDADPMTRAQNETGVGNTIGARMFTKMVQMGAYEVTGTVTRQQLQDMPLYGVDVIGKVLEAMQNQISQEINNRILDRVFKLGVENWKTQRDYQGVDLNLYIGSTTATSKQLSTFGAYRRFVGLDGLPVADVAVPNAVKNTAAENVHTHQRRIMSRVLAASNLIANVSRYGRGNWIVTNTQILSALQDCAGFVYAPMANTLTQDGSQSIYFAGSLAGLNIYVDPYMTWEDTRICVGRKGDGKTPGVVFMPYILADTVQTVAEGTMAPKLLVNSRFAIVDAGFHPAQNYYTFMVDAEGAYIL
jgi:hypothetical protein